MCPSYRVTLEEQHSTCGRARLLFEMLENWSFKDGWISQADSQETESAQNWEM